MYVTQETKIAACIIKLFDDFRVLDSLLINSLLFICDLYAYKQRGITITGCDYYKLDYGPYIKEIKNIRENLFNCDILEKTGNCYTIKKFNTEYCDKLLDVEEKKYISYVAKIFCKEDYNDIIEFILDHNPWRSLTWGAKLEFADNDFKCFTP